MCGIAGIVRLDGGRVDGEELARLGAPIRHRGPDDSGTYVDGGVGLIHNRLSIIDLSTGKQPIFNEDKAIAVIFNGEIYNFRSLRPELEKKGHVFYTNSDTEVIVHAYEEYGTDCVRYLKGMFAFAVYDKRSGSLFLARDRLGEKPLKYYIDGERFIFSSELKSILAMGVDREVDPDALSAYFSFLCVPAPLTIFKNIKKLPPGSSLLLKDGHVEVRRYWDLEYSGEKPLAERDYLDRIDAAIRESVESCMIADVPIGVFLSGGIDSSLVTSYLAELSDRPVKTFSVGFGDSINELPYAKAVADLYKTDHTEISVDARIEDIVESVVWFYEEPFADSSFIPTYLISREARKYVKVILTGDGGDELFGGYPDCYDLPKAILLREEKNPVKRLAVRALYKAENTTGLRFDRIFRLMAMKYGDKYGHYFKSKTYFDEAEKRRLLKDPPPGTTFELLKPVLNEGIRDEDKPLLFDLKAYLPEDLLVKTDIASMACSLETRAPLLDYELAELAFSIPFSLKIKNGTSKYLLRKLAGRRLPPDIARRKKQGFGAPVEEWLRSGLKAMVMEKLGDPKKTAYRYVNYDYVKGLLADFYGGGRDYGYRIWILFIFAIWCEQYLDSPPMPGGRRPEAVNE